MRPIADLLVCLRFFSRLPLPEAGSEDQHQLAAALGMVPMAGLIIGLIPAVVLAAALAVGLPPMLAAFLALAALVLTTGALHEDGLADCADGFGGGRNIPRKLEIMRDSAIGTFGACALILSLVTRGAAVSAIATRSPLQGVASILLAAMVSRAACLLPLILLPPARPEGVGASAGRPDTGRLLLAVAITVALGFVLMPLGLGALQVAATLVCALLGAGLVALVARRQIGGSTGDVAGAAQQVAEIACLLVLAVTPRTA